MKPVVLSAVLASMVVIPVAGYLGYQNVSLPKQRQLARLRQQLAEEQETQALRVQLAKALDDAERLRKRLPPEPNTEWLVSEIVKLASEEGVQLGSIMPQHPKRLQAQDATQLSVALKFNASYHQVGRFLSAVERAPSFMWAEEVTLNHAQADQALPDVQLTVSTIYVSRLGVAGPEPRAGPHAALATPEGSP